MRNLSINLIPISLKNDAVDIYIAANEQQYIGKLYPQMFKPDPPAECAQLFENHDKLSWAFNKDDLDSPNPQKLTVTEATCPSVYKKYLLLTLEKHFKAKSGIHAVGRSFTKEIQIYVKAESLPVYSLDKLKKYSIRVDYDLRKRQHRLLVTYEGVKFLATKPLSELSLPDGLVNQVIYGKRVAKYEYLPNEQKDDKRNVQVFVNTTLQRHLSGQTLQSLVTRNPNPYKVYYDEILKFAHSHLFGQTFNGVFDIPTNSFLLVDDEKKIFDVSPDANLLYFKKGQKHFVVYNGLKQYGPAEVPDTKNIRYIFIFHKDDKDDANKLYGYLSKGFKGFPGLERFVGLPIGSANVDIKNSIQFQGENPVSEIEEAVNKSRLDTNKYRYVAFYISRVGRDEEDEDKFDVYFKIKEYLLAKNITSQVIHKNNLHNPSFNFFLPNIAIALLAKLGGKPWKLASEESSDLIVGIGAYKDHIGNTYIGNAICFRNDGVFEDFDAFKRDSVESLGKAFEDSLKVYAKGGKGQKNGKLIIHFYKDMSWEEERELQKCLNNMNLQMPYVVLNINDTMSRDYVIFDDDFPGKMPTSGTFIEIRRKEYLLCNNTRYQSKTGTRIEGYPFPVKVRISKAHGVDIESPKQLKELINQVYQFSRIHWRSIRQKGMPVTVSYSKFVAKMVSHFDADNLPDTKVPHHTLWFL